jgi:uncharacterized protein (TIGR02453 family)
MASPTAAGFKPALFRFMRDLRANNNREWFNENKHRYVSDLKDPALAFILDFGQHLDRISPHFRADPRPSGGSLFRIYRDVRFARDKSPYKTHAGLYFPHVAGKNAHTPGFYLNLEPGHNWVGVGLWQPDSPTLKRLRKYVVAHPDRWQQAVTDKAFAAKFTISGSRLQRAPKGYEPDHPLIEVLKLKDYTAVASLTQAQVTGPDFLEDFRDLCKAGSSLVRFVCEALDQPF